EVADRRRRPVWITGLQLVPVQPLRCDHLERRHLNRSPGRRIARRRPPLAAVDLRHEEALLSDCARLGPALPRAAKVDVVALAAVAELHAIRDALRRLLATQRARPQTRHQFLLIGSTCPESASRREWPTAVDAGVVAAARAQPPGRP